VWVNNCRQLPNKRVEHEERQRAVLFFASSLVCVRGSLSAAVALQAFNLFVRRWQINVFASDFLQPVRNPRPVRSLQDFTSNGAGIPFLTGSRISIHGMPAQHAPQRHHDGITDASGLVIARPAGQWQSQPIRRPEIASLRSQ